MGAFSFDTNVHLTQEAQYELYAMQIGNALLIFYLVLVDLDRLISTIF